MFSIPQPAIKDKTFNASTKLPSIQVSEDSSTIDSLLRYCYPTRDPTYLAPKNLERILGASIKYDFDEAQFLVTNALHNLIQGTDPQTLQVFAIGCHHNCESLASSAASSWRPTRYITGSISGLFRNQLMAHLTPAGPSNPETTGSFEQSVAGLCYIPSMAHLISAGPYYRLIKYTQDGVSSTFCYQPSVGPIASEHSSGLLDQYPFGRDDADLIITASDGLKFKVHRAIIACNVELPVGAERPPESLHLGDHTPADAEDGFPTIKMTEDGETLTILLALCYPARPGSGVMEWTFDKLGSTTVVRAIKAAGKYKFTAIEHTYRSRLRQLSSKHPLRAYCIARILGWADEAEAAARQSLFSAISPDYLPEFESITAKDYYVFLKYHWDCQSIITQSILKQYPLADRNSYSRSVKRSTWLSHVDMAHCPTWPALMEYQVDLAAGKSRSPFDWKALSDTMLKTQSEVEADLKNVRSAAVMSILCSMRLSMLRIG